MTYNKAIVGAVVSALVAFVTALVAATSGVDNHISSAEWLTAALAALTALAGTGLFVYSVPNKPPTLDRPARRRRHKTVKQPPPMPPAA